MAEDFVLSASSINTFLRCGRQWFYAYVEGRKAPPSLRAVRGIAVHRAIELNMRQKIASRIDLPTSDLLDEYSTAYEAEIADGFAVRKDEDPGEVKDAGVGLVKVYQREAAPKIQPVLVEEAVSFKLNDQVITGQIDLADQVPINLYGDPVWRLRARDTKTSAREPAPEQYMLNMTIYALALRQAGHGTEADIIFDYLIATKKPRYEPISMGGPVSDERIRGLASVVEGVAIGIKAGSFPANGLMNRGVCDWCGYRNICPAYQTGNPNR